MENVVSPCISICRIEPSSGLCSGCLRTMDEIATWSALTLAERRSVLARVAERSASAEGLAPPRA